MAAESSTPTKDAEEMHERPDESTTNPVRRKFRELSREKQFGLMTLAALGTAMLVTGEYESWLGACGGRTVRIIMKRMAPVDSLPHPPHGSLKTTTELIKTRRVGDSDPATRAGATRGGRGREVWGSDREEGTVGRQEESWSSSSKEKKQREGPEGEEGQDFNAAMDGMKALGLATLLVVGSSSLAIRALGRRWELDGWDDWRIFIQAGQLGNQLIPPAWTRLVARAIPERLRPAPPSHEQQQQQQQLEDLSSPGWHWIHTLDREWQLELARRDAERRLWNARRKAVGKPVW